MTLLNCFVTESVKPIPIVLIPQKDFLRWQTEQDNFVQTMTKSFGFKADPGSVCMLPDNSGNLTKVLCGVSEINNFWNVGNLSQQLPEGEYQFETNDEHYTDFAISWGLGAYYFARYKKSLRKPAKLFLPQHCDVDFLTNVVDAIYLVRTLINTPTDDMGPSELAHAIEHIGKQFHADVTQIVGDDLLKNNYPLIHLVGRACDDAPRLVDLRWGDKNHPKLTLVGKGVCFDTGGLDLKNAAGMLLMKKDMGGAAHVLGLAHMIMQAKLPVNLRVLIPAVENSISGNAFRPGDVATSRKGLTIEVGNTDAEGRLVLADALAEAVSENPDLIIDMATLTGAARIALGTELPAMFANNDEVASGLLQHANKNWDPIWRMPLFGLYRDALNSSIADLNNNSLDSYGGAITAALFLKEFVPDTIPWVHFDIMAWNLRARPGRPMGGEAMGLRAIYSYLQERYS